MTTNEKLFFDHIGTRISRLAKAYKNAFDDIQDMEKHKTKISAAADNINYTITLNRLNAAINDFKREMKRSLQDYYLLMDNTVGISQYVAKHIESKLNDLFDEYTKFNENTPDDAVKKGLGSNYFFHKNLKKLTVEVMLNYFETNYMLNMEK